ncbi:hypothetical protein [Lacinutrix algicola]|uniref:hypothetical protein n=1 Tax=Lacinutrix algicola TaxID=342954 RepID=UPI0006E24292|nr:hypothetical protein [Lacinutrix algicola]
MTSKIKNNKWQFLTLILIVLMAISFGFYKSISDKNELKNSKNTIGIITEIEHRTSRGYFIHYDYKVNNKTYNDTQKLTIKKELINIGDKFKVIYSDNSFQNSELILEKPISE